MSHFESFAFLQFPLIFFLVFLAVIPKCIKYCSITCLFSSPVPYPSQPTPAHSPSYNLHSTPQFPSRVLSPHPLFRSDKQSLFRLEFGIILFQRIKGVGFPLSIPAIPFIITPQRTPLAVHTYRSSSVFACTLNSVQSNYRVGPYSEVVKTLG